MFILPGEIEYKWLAQQRPNNKRQNRILLLNAKKRILHGHGRPNNKTNDMNSITQDSEYYAN